MDKALPEAVIDHQIRALRARMGRPNEAPSDRKELAALEGELLRRSSGTKSETPPPHDGSSAKPSDARPTNIDRPANLPAAPDAFRGISMMGTASVKPLSSSGAPIKVGNYQLRPHEQTMPDGTKAVAYFIAYNTQTKKNDYVVGPGSLKSFEQAHAQLENLAAVYHQSGWHPYEAKSAAVVEHMMKDGFDGALSKLYEANASAVKDPAFWTTLVTNVTTGIATAEAPKVRAATAERPVARSSKTSAEPVLERRYKPTETPDPKRAAGTGATDKYGNVKYSPHGTAQDVALVRAHESVHSVLSPKQMNRLREFRADVRVAAYERSKLMKYLEEALAESYAQVKVNGVTALPEGIKFPITHGYCTLKQVTTEAAKAGAIGIVVYGGVLYAVHVIADAVGHEEEGHR